MKVEVLNIIENEDCSADLSIKLDYNKSDAIILCHMYNRKRVTGKLLERFVVGALTKVYEKYKKSL